MADQSEAMGWIGKTVVDRDGSEIGPCTTVLFDDTGTPEWLGVDHVGVRRKLPAAGAVTDAGRVRVALTRAQVMDAPQLAETPRSPGSTQRAGTDRKVMGALAVLGALLVAFLTRRWMKAEPEPEPEPEPAPSERLLRTAREAAGKAAQSGATVLDRTVAVAAPAAATAGRVVAKEGKRAGQVVAKEGKRAGQVVAKESKHAAGLAATLAATAAATAADEVGDLLESGAEIGHRVGDTIGEVPDALAASGRRLRKKWRRLTHRIVMVVALAGGYVLGSAAGRQRYEQLKQAADKIGAMASGSR